MKKQSGVKAKLKIFTIVILAMFMIAVYVLCEIKIERIRNEKIIGTWMQGNLEEVLTFHDNGRLIVNQDMPEAGISSGNACYEFVDIQLRIFF